MDWLSTEKDLSIGLDLSLSPPPPMFDAVGSSKCIFVKEKTKKVQDLL